MKLCWILVALLLLVGCEAGYEITKVEEIHSSVVGYEWHVVVDGPVSIEEMKDMALEIIEMAKKREDFNVLVIYFDDYPEYNGYGGSLGEVVFAPRREWYLGGITIEPGDYDSLKVFWNFKKKDWSLRLTQEEVDIWYAADRLFYESLEQGIFLSNDEVSQIIADQFEISPADVIRIQDKRWEWYFHSLDMEDQPTHFVSFPQ